MCGTVYDFVWNEGTPLPKNFPFCSERCKAADLAKWLNEEYAISTPLPDIILSDTERELLAELGMDLDDDGN
jgi:endogenous inhibitor of DNA gyrase (YacG/DUF329 family)